MSIYPFVRTCTPGFSVGSDITIYIWTWCFLHESYVVVVNVT